ncbi:hypothetical protein FON35_11960 [Vibrio parahaemolyticus]|nr:hypothetical protein [Vibrio parahaemolyticus]
MPIKSNSRFKACCFINHNVTVYVNNMLHQALIEKIDQGLEALKTPDRLNVKDLLMEMSHDSISFKAR